MASLSMQIRQARSEAFKEAKDYGLPWVFSRGAYVATVGINGDQCEPWPGADPYEWDGKVKSLPALIEKAKSYPHVAKVVVEGGYDGADTMEQKTDGGDYEPWIASWTVTVWQREPAPDLIGSVHSEGVLNTLASVAGTAVR